MDIRQRPVSWALIGTSEEAIHVVACAFEYQEDDENVIFDSIKYIFRYFNIFNIRKYVQLIVIFSNMLVYSCGHGI